MSKLVYIMVGAPGSGKSTRTKMHTEGKVSAVVSADHFFESSGTYVFDRSKLHLAHLHSQRKYVEALDNPDIEVVVVDNTNTTAKERKFYLDLAKSRGYSVFFDVLECDAKTCYARNVHGVPLDAIERMIARIDLPYGLSKAV